jgi:outer membrane protein TolC
MKLNGLSLSLGAILVLLFSGHLYARGENELRLSLNDALLKAKESNYELKLAQAEVDGMQADRNKSLAVFLPRITLSETFVKTDDPLNAFGLKLKQETVSQMDFDPRLLNNPDDIKNFNTKLEVIQPLLNFDGFFGRAAAGDGLSAMKHKQKRTEYYVEFMVKMSYYDLVLANNSLDVVTRALETARANRKLISDYYDEGLISKADYLMAEVYVSNLESQKVEAENFAVNASDQLKFALGIQSDVTIIPTDTLSHNEVNAVEYDVEDILSNRSDMQSYKKRVDALGNMHTMSWMKLLPRLNAFGSFEYNDTEMFGSQAENYMVGFNLQWNLFNGFRNIGDIQKTEAELDHAKTEYTKARTAARNDIEASVRDLNSARKRLVLTETAVDQSEESLRIIKDRYNQGLEKTTDLLNAETALSNSRMNYLKTLFFYNVSLFKIELMLEEKINNK